LLITSHILNDLDEIATDIIYIFEGKVQYNDTIEALKTETSENRLGKAIATLITQKDLLASIA
jgi:Cu-processing system ATP-binding protein